MAIEENLPQDFKKVNLKIPYDKQDLVNYFLDNYNVDYIDYRYDGTILNLNINEIDYNRYLEFIF